MADNGMHRKLRAIFSADVKGYSKLMGDDDEHTINTITEYRKFITELIEEHHGRVVDAPGDNILAEFSGALNAVNGAIAIQQKLKAQNSKLPENRRMDFRIGINLGDIVHREDRIYGDGVNIAARIESLADPGGICISRGVFDQVKRKVKQGFEYLGKHSVKNIPEPVRIYRVLWEPEYKGKVIGEHVSQSAKIKWPQAITIAIILLCSIALLWVYYPRPSDIDPASLDKMAYPLPEGPSIAVLPFVNLSGDDAQDYFSDGITEQIITSLSNVPYLFVIARNSTFTYKGKAVKVQQVAEDFGVRYVLEGSVQRSGDRLRINVQLIDAIAGHHLWAEHYDQTLGDIFYIQDQIAMKIMAALQVELSIADFGQLSAIKTKNLKAYEKLLQAREALLRRTEADITLSRQLAQEAIDLDPEYGAAYLQLAYTHLDDVWFYRTKSREASLNTAEELGYKAISFSGEGADTHRLFSIIYLLRRQYDEAVVEGRKAIALSPNSARTLFMFGMVLRFAGFYDEAIQNLEKAIRLDPITTVNYLNNLAWAYAYSMKYDKAISLWTQAIQKNPDYLFAHMGLAASYQLSGNDQKAKEHAANLMRIKPELSLARIRKSFFTNDETGTKRIQEALRLAGVPE